MATVGSNTNYFSVAERTSNIVFPTEAVRNEIPIWMKFYCYEYSNNAVARALTQTRSSGGINIPGLTNLKATILVPAPPNFEASTNLPYSAEPTVATELLPGMFGAGTAIASRLSGTLDTITRKVKNITDFFMSASSFGSELNVKGQDTKDLTFNGTGSYRNYDIRLYLPCLTVSDSLAAANVIKTFEALCLPTATSTLSLSGTRYFHPPLWIFGVGPADSLQMDPDWGGYPQLSALTQIRTRKQALDTNNLAAHASGGTFKPIAYSVTLLFREIEPAFRLTSAARATSTAITNRSGVMVSGGQNLNFSSR